MEAMGDGSLAELSEPVQTLDNVDANYTQPARRLVSRDPALAGYLSCLLMMILIANNGIAAVKCMRSLRKWAYATFRDSDALAFVCMATPEDVHANAEYIKMANKTVMVPGGSNPNNYANVELILQTAVTNEVDAVWAGWGHASENPQLPEVLSKNNIAFLGPSHYAMWALGDKVASTILAQSADVPTLPWSGSTLRVPLVSSQSSVDSISDQSFGDQPMFFHPQSNTLDGSSHSRLNSTSSTTTTVNPVGSDQPHFYLDRAPGSYALLKTRALHTQPPNWITPVNLVTDDLYQRACVTDAASCQSFADLIGYPIMIKAAEGGGGKVSGPLFVVTLVHYLCRLLFRLSKLVGYVSAGTVEYLYDPCTNQFYFLELNPRLQVEHPCTEVVAEVNLPACQLQIAMGIPLHQIKDIRDLYHISSQSDCPVSFEQLEKNRRPPSCYVIAARITSEDPDEGFKPRPGDVQELNFKSSQSVWGYFSVGSAGGIHEFADSQFGHCFSAAKSREQARDSHLLSYESFYSHPSLLNTVKVQSEVPGSPIFVMKCMQKCRHLEVQLLADQYGQAISLFGRDCSIQRRHQKIIEEAPIVVAPKETIDAMERAAVRLSKLVGYVSAGTVEYLYDPCTNQFYFLELNPRLQVEHPCTEVVAEVNLPACQLQIAMGIPLHQIKDIRDLYHISSQSDCPVSFEQLEKNRRPPSCYVIAARITSEDPDEGFKPRPGDVQELNFKSSQSVWGYFSVGSAGGIHEFADSQFGHCFSAAESREQAREPFIGLCFFLLYTFQLPVGKAAVDYRFFVRCIIRHADLLSTEASFEFLQSEAERTLLEAMDALELAHTHPDAAQTMGNHIFLNFAPILFLEDLNHLKSTIRKTVLRYARRFIRLRVTQAELKLRIRFQPSEPPVPIRVTLNDEQGFALGMDVYREVLHPTNGEILLWSLGPPRGPLHGLPALLPHEKKDYLQLKRFQARKFNTAYVYDYPKLITQALLALWSLYNPDRNAGILHSTGSADGYNLTSPDLLKADKILDSRVPIDLEAVTDSPNVGDIDENVVLSCTELALDAEGKLRPVFRNPGSNSIGMVIWHMVLRTPDTPTGRAIIVIANDATHMAGSFGPAEDLSFYRASHLARRLGIPRIYLASNTGARIRVAEEVKAVFRVAWLDPLHPEKGYDYLYLTPEDYEGLRAHQAVNCERLEVSGEVRYKILDIVGKSYDMSVENLRGSAMIAGETSAAYDDIFTITIVTNRAIGIGAYLARLGQRIIQVKNSHIILTGAMALNKLLGREVYSSNSQLGGVQVMANNGVSHLVASDELLALQQALDWLTYVPAERGQSVPIMYRPVPIDKVDCASFAAILSSSPRLSNRKLTHLPFDPIDRDVEYVPSRDRSNDDPRWMFTGVMASHLICTSDLTTGVRRPTGDSRIPTEPGSQSDHWLSGFFDWGTWRETLAAWAAGVVVGRARLGGIPCGAITAETRSVTCHVPADPANLSTEAQVVNQAGQVWYPDSAYKTAQAITDMARERLPLFVFASWRGFSGGMKDMYDQVLKFGSMIIDALRRYPEPVFVYLPPHSQLRGGAWVVVDPAINPDRMEMYADPISCRAGVLEPEGTVEIKYRKPDLIKTMHRLDEKCRHLIEEIDRVQTGGPVLTENSVVDPNLPMKDQCFHLQAILESRHKELRPFYHQIACTFADLHDTPGRLLSRGLVHGLVPWSKSRSFFYARLRRRLLELRAINLIDTVLGPDSRLQHEDDDLVEHFQKLNVTTRNITQVILGLKELQDSEKNSAIMKDGLSEVPRLADSYPTTILPHPFLPECPPASPIRTPSPPPAAPNKLDSSHAVRHTRSSVEITDEIAKSVPQLGQFVCFASFCRNLVLALKELSIRGDFRTTVEYLIKIMESEAFMNHRIDTDWLDKRIAQKDQVEKPDLLLGVVCTALHIADRSLRQLTRNYELHLERGQFLPSNTLTNCVDVNLVSGGTKFGVKVFRTGPSSFHLISNGSLLCIEAHRMSSDGLLVCHELASYMTYCHEDAEGYRTAINNRTMVFSKETDPSVLRSHSTGKLLQFTVADGAHVSANEVFALIEVMKLVLELRVPASGEISLKRIPGSTLEPGTELAHLKLDDPTQLKILQPYNGPLLLPCDVSSLERRATIQGDLKVHNTCFNALDSVGPSCAPSEEQRKKRASLCTISPDHALELRSAASTNFTHSSSSHSFGSSFPLANLCQSTSTLHRLSGEKLHHHFSRLLASLEQVLLGYALPEPFLTPWINQSLENLMSFLHDPRLPLLELQDTIAHLAGRLPPQLERELRTQAKLYAGQVTSVMAHFPSKQILRLIDSHIHRIRRGAGRRSPSDLTAIQSQEAEVVKFQQTVQRLVDLSERYLNGLRGHAVHVLSQLLLGYVVVERYFQHGQYDKCTRQLLARCHSTSAWANDSTNQNNHDEEEESSDTQASDARLCLDSVPPALQNLIQPHSIADIVAVIFSHRQLAAKNALIVRLIELLRERRELSTTCDLKGSLKALTELGATGNSKVALSARQLLISLQTPSYELRRNQAESIFLSAVDLYGNQFHPENLHKIITSETVVFDILTDFFYHTNQTVASAALEVYIRRAYTAYELTSIQHIQLPNGASFVPFRFTLPSAHCLTSDQPHFRKSSNTVGFDAVNTTYVSPTCIPSTRFIAVNSTCTDEKQLDNSMLLQCPPSSAVPNVDGSDRTPAVHWSSTISVAQSPNGDNRPESPTRLVTATGARSLANIDLVSPIGERMGAMAAFNSLDEFEESFEDIIALFAEACTEERTVHCSLSEPSLFNFCRAHFNDSANSQPQGQPFDTCRYPAMVTFQDPPYQTTSPEEEPIHILNIALRHSDGWSDISEISSEIIQPPGLIHDSDPSLKSGTRRVSNVLNEGDDVVQLEAFCSAHAERLRSVGIRRITFIIVKTREFPKCYTFRARDNYCEDLVYRHLEPALAFQLELNRMRNYKLEHLPTLNRRMHLYLAKSKFHSSYSLADLITKCSDVSDENLSGEPSGSSQQKSSVDSERHAKQMLIWNEDHLAVGDWLAEQLGVEPLKCIPISDNLGRKSVVMNKAQRTGSRPSLVHENVDALCSFHSSYSLADLITKCSDVSDENLSGEPSGSSQQKSSVDSERHAKQMLIWNEDHLAVGDWLAEQLGVEPLKCIPISDNLGRKSVVMNKAQRTGSRPSLVHENVDALCSVEMFEKLRGFLSQSLDVTDQLGAVLSDTLDTTQRAHLVQLLSSSLQSADQQFDDSKKFPQQSLS
ncbi:hypothetical protein AHF37_01156 [Paragonimus kellicotti]|nr:hypothetical protein AHF37_01156 [Paragonimus kellicotti]